MSGENNDNYDHNNGEESVQQSVVNDLLSGGLEKQVEDIQQEDQPAPSAPSADWDIVNDGNNGNGNDNDNGNEKPLVDLISDTIEQKSEAISNALSDIESSLRNEKVLAEADSSSSSVPGQPATQDEKEPSTKKKSSSSESSSSKPNCVLCPYYLLGCNYVNQIEVPPKVKDILLWKDPKCTGAIFGSSLVLLLALASLSFLTVVGSLMLLALSAVGAYRFYLALMFRIKGTPDETFEKLSSYDLSLPKDKVKDLAHLLETDVNKAINKIKSVILWDSVTSSSIAFGAFYILYCIGSIFNTITLFILVLVSAFTLPKVYQIYKKPIDALIEKGTTASHLAVKSIMAKLPFLNNKQKTQ